ncbi:hypothetical protein WBG78_15725 [Chryseolinea sp. T2]|uniref:hypothetical protein n=1 Tax=Chryseolinea sp. T2 TaxID=3129255 RepID=UPI0030787AFD
MVQVVKPRTSVYGVVVLEESRKFLLVQTKDGFEVWTKVKDRKGHLVKPSSDQQFFDGPYWFYMKRSNAEKKVSELSRGVRPVGCSL